jgi:hypothetical protein
MDNTLKQGQNFTDTAGRTGVVNFDTQTGQRLQTGQTTPLIQNSNVITTGSLQPQNLIEIPKIPTPQTPSIDGDIAFFNNLQAQQTAEQQRLNQQMSSKNTELERLMRDLSGQGQEQLSLEQQIVNPIQTQITDIMGQFQTKQAEYKNLLQQYEKAKTDIEVTAGSKGLTTNMMLGQQGAIARNQAADLNVRASEMGILQAQALALQGKADLAQQQIDRAVDLKYTQVQNEIGIKQFQLGLIKDSLTKEENKRANALTFALNKEEKRIEEQKTNEKTANQYLMNAIQGKAPNSLILQAQDLINKGAKATDVARVLGNYSLSLSERIDNQYKQTQMDKINFEMSQARTKEAKEAVALKQAAQAQLPKVKEELDAINNLLSNTLGLEKSTALTGLGRFKQLLSPKVSLGKPSIEGAVSGFVKGGIPGAIIGASPVDVTTPVSNLSAKKDFIATVSQLTSTGTLNTLIKAKADGATFGALSDAELALIQQSFSKLGSYAIRNKDGKITGFSASDDLIEEELRKIGDSSASLYQSLGGVLEPDTPIGTQKADNFVDIIKNQGINNYGYQF